MSIYISFVFPHNMHIFTLSIDQMHLYTLLILYRIKMLPIRAFTGENVWWASFSVFICLWRPPVRLWCQKRKAHSHLTGYETQQTCTVFHGSVFSNVVFFLFVTKGDIHSLQRQIFPKDVEKNRADCGFKGLTEGSVVLEGAIWHFSGNEALAWSSSANRISWGAEIKNLEEETEWLKECKWKLYICWHGMWKLMLMLGVTQARLAFARGYVLCVQNTHPHATVHTLHRWESPTISTVSLCVFDSKQTQH